MWQAFISMIEAFVLIGREWYIVSINEKPHLNKLAIPGSAIAGISQSLDEYATF